MIAAGCSQKQLDRFEACGSHCHVWHSPSKKKNAIRGDFCKSRWCVPCAVARSKLIQNNLCRFVAERRVRFLTLTLLHRHCPLSKQLTRIWRCFKELRTMPEWAEHVRGFAAFLEVKWSPRTKAWHVHLHILTEGIFWDQREISQLWKVATGDSMIVDIQAKGTSASMAYYGAKYASKPLDSSSMETTAQHAEAIVNLGRRRLWLIGGIWKGNLKLLARGLDPKDWEYVGSANALFADGATGVAEALALIDEIVCRTKPLPPPPDSDTS